MSAFVRALGTLTLATLSVACSSVLGIEKAEHDPALDNAAGGTGQTAEPLCKQYCETIQSACKEADGVGQYPSGESCLANCAALLKTGRGETGDTTGNTVNCRLTYAKAAATAGERALNCSLAGPSGFSPGAGEETCGTPCSALCAIASVACAGTTVKVPNCEAACGAMPSVGNYNDGLTEGRSQQCLVYHATAAAVGQPALHCGHLVGLNKDPCQIKAILQ